MSDTGPSYPLLLLGTPSNADRDRLGSGRGGQVPRRPSAQEQAGRLGGKWAVLEQALADQRAALTADLAGVDPELVLVFEVAGTVEDFINAVRQIDGFEFLAEIDETGIDDEAFVEPSAEGTLNGSLYLMASNQDALAAVLGLWRQYQADEAASFPYGLARWKQVFQLLVDVRRWGPSDRLRGTGAIEDFAARLAAGAVTIPAEIELWFRGNEAQRVRAEQVVAQSVQSAGGQVLARATIAPIAYHALLVSLPAGSLQPILAGQPEDFPLAVADEIAFIRPEAQAIVALDSPTTLGPPPTAAPGPVTDDPPLVAVLDGLPLAAHSALDGRLMLDDPDDWASGIDAASRQHGTAVTSLVLHGDAAVAGRGLSRRVYVRPVLRPEPSLVGARECIPHDQLAIDLIYRSVLRIKGSPAEQGAAPEVRLVNLSIGDSSSPLTTTMSPWARLLDYLAYRYDLLFVVSAGNHARPLHYPYPRVTFEGLAPDALRRETLRLLLDDAASRRILSPSEAVSALCVGSAHDDASGPWVADARRDVLPGAPGDLDIGPSPITAAGMGYRRSIKPDLIAPGGRVLFRLRPQPANSPTTIVDPAPSDLAPGLTVAAASAIAGALDRTRHFHGTSGAAALVSHYGAIVLESLSALTDDLGNRVDPSAWSVLAKALIVHACALPPASELRALLGGLDPMQFKDAMSRFYGYGLFDPARLLGGDASRATAVGWGDLADGEAACFDFPLPPSLSGQVVPRRLVVTLAYFPPIRVRDRRHRAAELFVRPDRETLAVARQDLDWRTVRRGSVQHEILAGTQAAAFVDGAAMRVKVNCRALVGSMKDRVPFGLAVTLEVGADLPIHAEVAARIHSRTQARIRP